MVQAEGQPSAGVAAGDGGEGKEGEGGGGVREGGEEGVVG